MAPSNFVPTVAEGSETYASKFNLVMIIMQYNCTA